MASQASDYPFVFSPNPAGKGPQVSGLTLVTLAVTGNLSITGTINGQPISGTIVTTSAVQTLTNKTLSDTTTAIAAAGDSTVKIKLVAAGATGTTATLSFANTTTRTYTVPDVAVDSSIVVTTGNQAITGTKTFSSVAFSAAATLDGTNLTVSNLTIPAGTNSVAAGALSGQTAVANGGTGAASLTVHGVLIGNAASAVNVTAAGASGQVLTGNGNTLDPTFQTTAVPPGTSFTTNAVLLGNATGTLTTVSGLGVLGNVLTSNGPGVAPTWQAASGTNVTTKGDLQTFSTVATRLAVGADYTSLIADSSTTTGLAYASPNKYIIIHEDFINQVASTAIGAFIGDCGAYSSQNFSSGNIVSDPNHPGLLGSNSLVNGTAYIQHSSDIPLGGGTILFNAIIRIGTLSTVTNRYVVRLGYGAVVGSAAENAWAAYWEYSDNLNNGAWRIYVNNNTTPTIVNTGNTVVANTYWNYGILVNAAATQITFLQNGSPVSIVSSPIPTQSRNWGFECAFSSGTIPLAALAIDGFQFICALTSSR